MYICQLCKKNPATIHLTDIHNNVKKEVHICESCATEKGFNIQGASNLPQLLGLAAKKMPHAPVQAAKVKAPEEELVCLKCGTTWSQFGERGRLGCPNDYQAFDAKLRQLVTGQLTARPGDRESLHVGKRPGPRKEADELERAVRDLEKKLKRAVSEENYEAAATLKAELERLRPKRAPEPTHGNQ